MSDDASLVKDFLAGDEQAFNQIVARYERRVWAICLRMCCDVEDARDATQDAFVTAFRSLHSFRGDAALSTWLHRIAVNASFDVIRKRNRQRSRPIDERFDLASGELPPDEQAIRSERALRVQNALRKLSDDHRAVVVLHDIQGLEYPEVAEVLELPLGTVKSRLHRARAELARMLGHLKDSEPKSGSRPLT
ncbi:MAG: RNA polymerase sigma factor [Actinomycetota bacterium]